MEVNKIMECISRAYASMKEYMQAENNMKDEEEFLFPDESSVQHMSQVSELILKCINERYKIFLIGDYDVDGVMSLKILSEIFKYLKYDVYKRIPKRISEGYGLSNKIIDEIIALKEEKNLAITIDNGITAVNQIKRLNENGFIVVVIDHHEPLLVDENIMLPKAEIIVDPKVYKGEFNDFCAAGLASKLAELLLPKEKLNDIYVYAMLATIADVVSVTGNNRIIIKRGFRLLNERNVSPTLLAFIDTLNVSFIDEDKVGYTLGPAINAAGRLIDDGAQTVSFNAFEKEDYYEACEEFRKMVEINSERKALCDEGIEKCLKDIKENDFPTNKALVLYNNFHEGIVGILAGKISERFQVPAVVLTNSSKEDIVKGSGRTAQNESLINLLRRHDEFFVGYGGHDGAAGMSLEKADVDKFREAFAEKEFQKENRLFYDMDIAAKNLLNFFYEQNVYSPFGNGNKKPLVKVSVELSPRGGLFHKELAEGRYARCFGNGYDIMLFDGIIQDEYENMYDKWKKLGCPNQFDVLAYVSVNHFNGEETVQLMVQDICKNNDERKKNSFFDCF